MLKVPGKLNQVTENTQTVLMRKRSHSAFIHHFESVILPRFASSSSMVMPSEDVSKTATKGCLFMFFQSHMVISGLQ